MVGNGVTDWTVDTTPAQFDFYYGMSIITREMHQTFKDNDCFWDGEGNTLIRHKNSKICNDTFDRYNEITSGIFFYDVLRAPECECPIKSGHGVSQKQMTPWVASASSHPNLFDATGGYFNRADVRKAFHILPEVGKWAGCGGGDYEPQVEASLWIYKVLRGHMRILKYSGDSDGAVPTVGTRRWIEKLNWEIKGPYRPWIVDNQVAGYVENRDGMDFVTIHGVGHMAPQWKPKEVQKMITNWVYGLDF